jgi:hypothetical protein
MLFKGTSNFREVVKGDMKYWSRNLWNRNVYEMKWVSRRLCCCGVEMVNRRCLLHTSFMLCRSISLCYTYNQMKYVNNSSYRIQYIESLYVPECSFWNNSDRNHFQCFSLFVNSSTNRGNIGSETQLALTLRHSRQCSRTGVFNLSDSAGHIHNFSDAHGPQNSDVHVHIIGKSGRSVNLTTNRYIMCRQWTGLAFVVIFSKRPAGHALKTPVLEHSHYLCSRRISDHAVHWFKPLFVFA